MAYFEKTLADRLEALQDHDIEISIGDNDTYGGTVKARSPQYIELASGFWENIIPLAAIRVVSHNPAKCRQCKAVEVAKELLP